MNIFVWSAEKPAKSLWSDQRIHHNAIPAKVIVLKNSFQPTHPCPAYLKTACPAWETPPAADHLPAMPVAQDPAVAAEKIWVRPKEMTEYKYGKAVHINFENEQCQVSHTSKSNTYRTKTNSGREPSLNYIQMATRTDKRRIIKDPDGYGKRTGTCGDTVEMFLLVRHNRIHKVFFVTDGCINTHACANGVAFLAEGKSIVKAWEITPDKVIRFLETLPEENTHCAELAVGALYLALVNFQEFRHAPWKRLYGKRT
jgi:nitrogen fixation NifU-like protein